LFHEPQISLAVKILYLNTQSTHVCTVLK